MNGKDVLEMVEGLIDFGMRRKKAEQQLERSVICEENKTLIRRFVEFKTACKVTNARQSKYLIILRLMAEKFDLKSKPFTEFTKEDVIKLIARIERSELSDWSKYDYEIILKTFLKWLGKEDIITWLKVKTPRNLPSEVLSEDEMRAMIDAAFSLRDKALIAMLFDGGFRIGELGGMLVKNISFDEYGAVAMVTGKTGPRRVRLIWSTPYVAQYLESHPLRNNREAPFWLKHDKKGMEYETIRKQLFKIAKRAGITKKVNPQNFRHSSATYHFLWLTESQMCERFGWVQGSRMPRVYSHLSDRHLDTDLLRMHGLKTEEEKITLRTVRCPFCRALNTADSKVCINCKRPLQISEAMAMEEKEMQLFREFMELLATKPEIQKDFMDFINRK